nr:hypothetical protein CFP56_65696 [Quercus suber]
MAKMAMKDKKTENCRETTAAAATTLRRLRSYRWGNSVGIGVVLRDYTERVEAALSKKLYAHLGPLEIEAKVLEEGVSFAWDVSIRDLVVESNSQIVIDALRVVVIENVIEGHRASC